MIAASPATKPERMPGTLERLDRLVKRRPGCGSRRGRAPAAACSAPSGGCVARSRSRSSTRRWRSRSRGGRTARTACCHSASGITAPVGLPGEQTYSSCVRAQWRRRSPHQSTAKLRAGSLLANAVRRAGQQRRAFVDLIERIRAHHGGAGARRIDHRLREREQRLARAVHRQHLGCRIDAHAVAALPASRRSPRASAARRRWPGSRQPVERAAISACLMNSGVGMLAARRCPG